MFDSERFISEVEKRPAIYALTTREYSDKGIRARCWNEIGEVMYPEWWEEDERGRDHRVKELSRKWRAIRDSYVKDYRRHVAYENGTLPPSKKRRYMFHKQLQFLTPFIRDARETSSRTLSADESMDEQQNWEIHNQEYAETKFDIGEHGGIVVAGISESPRKKKRTVKKKLSTTLDNTLIKTTADTSTQLYTNKEEHVHVTSDKYGNKSFLLSFLPLMDGLPMHKCLEARLKIAQIFREVTSTSDKN